MKILFVIILSVALSQVKAQIEIPKGYKKGSVTLADNSKVSGAIKDNIHSNASVVILSETGQKKKYDASDILSAEIEGTKFICINGDFFSVICDGELCFLLKASDAAGKISYNGATAIVSNGTEGSRGDFFIYDSQSKNLKLISKKNFDEVVTASFKGNIAAIDKAKSANGEIAQLKEAVIAYNARNDK